MKVYVKLQYKGMEYEFVSNLEYDDLDGAEFMWTEGNWACDCNKSIFINEHCDNEFPHMECGEEIQLLEIKEASDR